MLFLFVGRVIKTSADFAGISYARPALLSLTAQERPSAKPHLTVHIAGQEAFVKAQGLSALAIVQPFDGLGLPQAAARASRDVFRPNAPREGVDFVIERLRLRQG